MFKEKYFGKSKENRKAYHGAKACDKTCRNHGTDDWSLRNRMNSTNRNIERSKSMLNDFLRNGD